MGNNNNNNAIISQDDTLLIATFGYTILCIFVGFLLKFRKKQQRQQQLNQYAKAKQQSDNSMDTSADTIDTTNVEAGSIQGHDSNNDNSFELSGAATLINEIPSEDKATKLILTSLLLDENDENVKRNFKPRQSSKHPRNDTDTETDDDSDVHVDTFYSKKGKKRSKYKKLSKKMSRICCPGYKSTTTLSSQYHSFEQKHEADKREFRSEIREVSMLAIPWSFSSLIDYASSVVTIAIISHYIGVAEMITYSYVWFLLDAAHIISGALGTSLYKHVNNSAATETAAGYYNGGRYIRICIIINSIFSFVISVIMIMYMDVFLGLFGYGERVTGIANGYTALAAIHNFIITTSSFVSIIPDIEGHANFDAAYGLIDHGISIAIACFVVPAIQPTLWQLELIHIGHAIVSIVVYYFITWRKNGWFDEFKEGMFTSLDYNDVDTRCAFQTLLKKTLPMFFDEISGELEWLSLTAFAAYLGSDASATWILLSYLWGLITVFPDCVASATEYRVSNQLSKGNIVVAHRLSRVFIIVTAILQFIVIVGVYFARNGIIFIITQDNDIEEMMLEIIPYILFCQPIACIATTVSYLNRALAMYQRSTKIELASAVFVTIPSAFIFTYILDCGIEGLMAATFIGHATVGLLILAIFMNANWEKAVRKNMILAGTYHGNDDIVASGGRGGGKALGYSSPTIESDEMSASTSASASDVDTSTAQYSNASCRRLV